jgi:hypothetical protein
MWESTLNSALSRGYQVRRICAVCGASLLDQLQANRDDQTVINKSGCGMSYMPNHDMRSKHFPCKNMTKRELRVDLPPAAAYVAVDPYHGNPSSSARRSQAKFPCSTAQRDTYWRKPCSSVCHWRSSWRNLLCPRRAAWHAASYDSRRKSRSCQLYQCSFAWPHKSHVSVRV